MILGIDEVGRGPWAGPLVVGAVVLSQDMAGLEGLTDSKKLSAKRRVELDAIIRKQALGWGLGWVHAQEIDEVGLSAALRLATIRAVQEVKAPYHEIVIDGTINFLKDTAKGSYVTTMPKADFLIPAVSAASIIAKVARDAYMEQQDLVFPGYGLGSHVGYGTAKHASALQALGVTELHRKSFAPIAKLIGAAEADQPQTSSNTTKSIGGAAESKVADWLEAHGYLVTERNWKTKYCEIDIVATKDAEVYFIEVKYRSSAVQGGGLAAITPKKLQQMRFAAELYCARYKTTANPRLAVVGMDVSGAVELLQVD
ncbi:MAG: ribonuclease HII [Candidatus Microsaccharimonas sp.]